jgi:hypothetical protein
MIEEFCSLLAGIDPQLPTYFLVKGVKAVPVPKSKEEFEKLIANGYEPLVKGVVYEELSQEVISALHEVTRWLGGRILVPWPTLALSLLWHEVKHEGRDLQRALSSKKKAAKPSAPEDENAEGVPAAKRRSRR